MCEPPGIDRSISQSIDATHQVTSVVRSAELPSSVLLLLSSPSMKSAMVVGWSCRGLSKACWLSPPSVEVVGWGVWAFLRPSNPNQMNRSGQDDCEGSLTAAAAEAYSQAGGREYIYIYIDIKQQMQEPRLSFEHVEVRKRAQPAISFYIGV